jgi:hypothetical protein
MTILALVASILLTAFHPAEAQQPLASPAPTAASSQIEFDRIQEGVLYFKPSSQNKTPSPLQTNLTDAQLIGVLHPIPGGEPFALIAGKTCKNCLADPGLFALAPSGGKPSGYLYPGKILEPKNRSLAYEARAFYGRCMSRKKQELLIIFQRETVDRKHGLLKSVLIAEPALEHLGGIQSHIHDTLLEAHLPQINDTLRLVKKHECFEIEGRNRVMLSKPLDIQMRSARGMRDEDDESATGSADQKNNDQESSDQESSDNDAATTHTEPAK